MDSNLKAACALVVGGLLTACAQSPRGPATSTVPPADKPLAVDPALLGAPATPALLKPRVAANEQDTGPRDAAEGRR